MKRKKDSTRPKPDEVVTESNGHIDTMERPLGGKKKKPAKRTPSKRSRQEPPLPEHAQAETVSRPAAPPPPPPKQGSGRLANTVVRVGARWFIPGFIPSECLVLVVGEPRTGKSTFGAWLCAQSSRPAILPGHEEDVSSALLPRLEAANCQFSHTLLLDDRVWSLPRDRIHLTHVLNGHRCDLLWIDPIDSYVGECSENDGAGVRTSLESLARLARDVGCAVIAARHPGKSIANICPGSRQWRAVPREIIELRRDPGPPERRILRCVRDPFNVCIQPRSYMLTGAAMTVPTFELGEPVAVDDADTIGVGDTVDRWMVDEACELIRALLRDGEVLSTTVYKHAEEQRLRERTVRLAARRLGVEIRREGSGLEHRSHWSLKQVDSGTPAE